jgi:Xaa-Pro aminopeptidase/Xaa-Pro dipeptidase
LARLRERFAAAGVQGILVTGRENVFYLSGFSGSAGVLLLDATQEVLLTDGRYVEQARRECPGFAVVEAKRPWPDGVAALVRESGLRCLGIEAANVTYDRWAKLAGALAGVELVPLSGLVEELRMVKEPAEIALVREAVRLVDAVFARCLAALRPGVRERDWALELEFALRRAGAERAAFEFIVASGWRAALPHGVASEKEIAPGELVVIDCGAVVGGYHSDFTRTVAVGAASPWQREVYRAVRAAQQAAVAAIKPGVPAGEIDRVARSVLAEYGYGEFFTHSTGHGLGLAIHEEPRLAEGVETLLAPGMVVTVEPGVYLPGQGGVRIEDVVVVTPEGAEVLTATPKEELLITGR